MTPRFVAAAMINLLLAIPSQAVAQCVNSMTPSCAVYTSCFAKACNCSSSPTEYFESYGLKYCKAFLADESLSPQGKRWRDTTLRCLQERIVPLLPQPSQACDCAQMQSAAFDHHVACYTQTGSSICDLPASDWLRIGLTAEAVTTLMDQKGRKQMLEVARVCVNKVGGETKKAVEAVIEKFK